jgi:hypothetical protein
MLSADSWAMQQWGTVELGDVRRKRRAVAMGARMVAQPEASLPQQMGSRAALRGAYGLLNHAAVTLEQLLAPHREATLAAAGQSQYVLMVQDTTELDFTAHPHTQGLGAIGDGGGQGLLLHSTLAVVPDTRQVLGLAHAQVVLRQPRVKPRPKYTRSDEGCVWERSAQAIGPPPPGVVWVHVVDGGGDIFEFMTACRQQGKHFIAQVCRNRRLLWEEEAAAGNQEEMAHLRDYARSLAPAPGSAYGLRVPATKTHPAREARLALAWAPITVPPSSQAPPDIRRLPPLGLYVVRAWEPEPPEGAEAVEWILTTSWPVARLADAQQIVSWYTCRWICEEFHQCLKTGCRVERTQLDDGADIRRLLGFAAPIAMRLLQLRDAARNIPDLPADQAVEPLMVQVLARRQKQDPTTMTVLEFWQSVARLGGHQGRRRDGSPGWRTVWRGWRLLSEWTEGARLFANPDG